MGILDKLFGGKGERERKLGQKPYRLSNFAHKLLSLDIKESDTAIVHALDLSKQGKTEGLKAVEEAIRYMHGKENIEFYTPSMRAIDGFSALDNAPKEILKLAKMNALWTTEPQEVQELLSLSQVGGTEVRTLFLEAKKIGYVEEQVRAIQLLGLHLACQVALGRNEQKNAEVWNNEGVALYKLGKPEEAITCYDKALEIDTSCAQAWHNKGLAIRELGKPEEAITYYNKALEINPGYADALNNKGDALVDLQRIEEAITSYEESLQINPMYGNAWYNKGIALANIEKPQEAVACFDKVLEINPKDANAWYNKGSALFDLGRFEEAITCCDKALDIDSKLAQAWNNKGLALHKLGKPEEAIVCYDKALEIDTGLAQAWCNKGDSLVDLNMNDNAIEAYQGFIKYAPPQYASYVLQVKELIGRLKP